MKGPKIPPYISAQYPGGARGYKQTKRHQVKMLLQWWGELQSGAAYLPDDAKGTFAAIGDRIKLLQEQLKAKNWK